MRALKPIEKIVRQASEYALARKNIFVKLSEAKKTGDFQCPTIYNKKDRNVLQTMLYFRVEISPFANFERWAALLSIV